MIPLQAGHSANERSMLESMSRAEIISLIACLAAVLALIPSYWLMFGNSKSKKRARSKGTESGAPVLAKDAPEPTPMPAMVRALALTAMGFAILVIELVVFGLLSRLFGVPTTVAQMPTLWQVGFYAIFAIPALLFFFAFMVVVGMMGD
jgi:hypothetical protein